MQNFKLSTLLLAILLTTFACEDSSKETGDQAPMVPPASTMEMSLDHFEANNNGGRTAEGYVNIGNAWTNIAVWNSILGAHLIIPVAAFKAAASQEAVFDEENIQWTWTYVFNADGTSHTALLTAKFAAAGVQWDMYISKSGAYENVHWFTGTSNLQGTAGEWHLNYQPEDPQPFIDIAWSRESDNSAATIKYTNAIPEGEHNGSYIEYGFENELDLNAYYNIYLSKEEAEVQIKWNTTSKEGRIQNASYFGNDDFHCWNSLGQDVDCE